MRPTARSPSAPKGDRAPQVYKVDEVTKITVNNTPGKFSDLKVGQEVTDSVERDAHTLDSITVQGRGASPAAAAAGKEHHGDDR